ncbi:MAG TPA: RNA polymerase sigma factor [Chthoniobacteraceae bacterium]|nr:RNA polymerase sigma factor [Chthoniobacteraceae bacterium]
MPHRNLNENWRTCFEELAPKLLLYARQWLPMRADAEDAVQNAFVKFWKQQPDAGREHYPLLYSAVRSAALDLIRQRTRRTGREAKLAEDGVFTPDASWFEAPEEATRETQAAIVEALARLPGAQREVLALRIWGELTFRQIAEVAGESINTIAARYRSALEALRRTMKPREYERV